MGHKLLHTKPCLMAVKTSAVLPGNSASTAYIKHTRNTEHLLVRMFLSKLSAKRSLSSRHAECHGSCRKIRHSTVRHFDITPFTAVECSSTKGEYELSFSLILFQNPTTCLSTRPPLHTIQSTLNAWFRQQRPLQFPLSNINMANMRNRVVRQHQHECRTLK
jgi:hypothetical protein